MLVWPSFLYASYFIKCMHYFIRYIRAFQLGTLPNTKTNLLISHYFIESIRGVDKLILADYD